MKNLLAKLFTNSVTVCVAMFITALAALISQHLGFILAFVYFIGALIFSMKKA